MSKDKIESGQNTKSCRRSRKDQQGRDHICGCGKSYLSYPALYTHIKTKHNGVRPQGTFKNGSINGITISLNSNDLPFEERVQTQKNMLEQDGEQKRMQAKVQPRISQTILKSIEEFVKSKDLRIVNKLNGKALGFTNPNLRITKQQAGYQLAQKYDYLVTISEKEDQEILNHFIQLTSSTDLETILVVYLFGVGRFVSTGMMQYYENFANAFLNCFYTHSSEIWHSILLQNKQKPKNNQSNSNPKTKFLKQPLHISSQNTINQKQCQYSPIIHQYFNNIYIPQIIQYENQQIIIKIINQDFCKWMYQNNLTPLDIKTNKNHQEFNKDLINCREKATSTDPLQKQQIQFNVDVISQISIPKTKAFKKQKKTKNLQEKSKTLEQSCQKQSTSQNYPIIQEPYYQQNIDHYYQTNQINYDHTYNYLQNYQIQENLYKKIDEEIDQYFS